MPFRIYAAILSSQLIVTVADRVPEFDSKPYCRTYSSGDSLQSCFDSEKLAHEEIVKRWPNYTAHDKATCVMEVKMAGLPSYTGWLTCLDINANARRVDAAKSGTMAPAAGTVSPAVPPTSAHARRHRPGGMQP
jgi:hypothetical protein